MVRATRPLKNWGTLRRSGLPPNHRWYVSNGRETTELFNTPNAALWAWRYGDIHKERTSERTD